MNRKEKEKMMLAFVIADYIPGVLRDALFRRTERGKAERQKIIKCPYCTKRLTAVNGNAKVELYKYSRKTDVPCHEYRRCNSCGETVGLVFA